MIPPLGRKQPNILRLPETSPLQGLLRRILLSIVIIVVVAVFLWFDRGSLRDNTHPERVLRFSDVLYFTVVSLTTVGYGDITPVTQHGRLINAVLLTPIRLFLWALFLGTAYELILQRYREGVLMKKLQQRLNHHVIICGYGVKGKTIVAELLAHGHPQNEILIIEINDAMAQEAAARGLAALHGDASSESILHSAMIDKASHVIVAPERDDICVLICLTARALAPQVKLIASAREEENIKLLYRAGADVVVSPSLSGGRLMAAAVRQSAVPEFLEDMLSFGQGVDAKERFVRPEEVGKRAHDLPDLQDTLILGVKRGTTRCPFHEISEMPLEKGDLIVYLVGAAKCAEDPA